MNTAPTAIVSDGDRLSMTLFFATAIHAVAILGVSFGIDLSPPDPLPPTMDIILVQTRSDVIPADTQRIAQHNQQASGQSDDDLRPSSPVTSIDPTGTGNAQQRSVATPPRQKKSEEEQRIITAKQAEEVRKKDVLSKNEDNADDISLQEMLQRSLEIARLTSEIDLEEQAYAKRPRIKYLDTLSARSAAEAAYIQSWVNKVERVGNLNYPDEAIRNKLSGTLILSVLLRTDGQVEKITVDRSSGHQTLDDAAIRIVKQSSPFSDFPPDMAQQYDQLMITRTWVFHSDYSLVTQ